jgi:N-acetylmuramoyl-L-alanine amidase
MHDEIKRRLLREVVQANLATYDVAPATTPPRVERRLRVAFGTVFCLAVALVLLPVDDMSMVISTVVEQRAEEPPRPPVMAQRTEALAPTDESTTIAEQRVAAREPQVEVPPPVPAEVLLPSEEVEGPEPMFAAPVPIDLAVLPLRVKKIALDPGHGGKDVGASLPTGLTEKELTLDIGLRLRRLLAQAAFAVVMTRDKDETIPLAQRAALANAHGADLFVSIHVNWIERSQARGMETYYLGPTEDPLLLQLAAQENRDSGYSLADFRRLLDGIYLSVRRDESRRLAETVQRTLVTSIHPKHVALVNRGVKTAPFAVLVGTEMPAILAEVACLSNAAEAQLLATPQYRQDIAQALFQGIRAYARSLNRSPKKGS